MFRYHSKATYQPNGGHDLQVLSGKDLYKQTIVISTGGTTKASSKDGVAQRPQAQREHTFPARFLNIFVDYQKLGVDGINLLISILILQIYGDYFHIILFLI